MRGPRPESCINDSTPVPVLSPHESADVADMLEQDGTTSLNDTGAKPHKALRPATVPATPGHSIRGAGILPTLADVLDR